MRNTYILLTTIILLIGDLGCSASNSKSENETVIQTITSVDQFNSIIENSGNRLLLFDLYADWCMPCHAIAPIIKELAQENKENMDVFMIDTDKFPEITAAFGVTGIPFVVFVRNKQALYALIGVQSKESYTKIIESFADSLGQMVPQHKKINGFRINYEAHKTYHFNFDKRDYIYNLKPKYFLD
jgi:thioredoxin